MGRDALNRSFYLACQHIFTSPNCSRQLWNPTFVFLLLNALRECLWYRTSDITEQAGVKAAAALSHQTQAAKKADAKSSVLAYFLQKSAEKEKDLLYNYPALRRVEKKKGSIISLTPSLHSQVLNVLKITAERRTQAESQQRELLNDGRFISLMLLTLPATSISRVSSSVVNSFQPLWWS